MFYLYINFFLQRNKEGFQIARLYFEVRDYEQANSYLVNYLSEFSLDAHAWNLKGELREQAAHSKDLATASLNALKAIDDYTKSYELSNQSDKELILKSKINDIPNIF
jgi:hypothetical protein